ncbi:hypothetical protein N7492_004712 [Penicillium capsulatum]|uniref:Uncharacterized protein n=1 Tax=Penicillium capsulatum TaxID=69766 RepID=A0A9W9LQA6_9EURO|nr:hypothetical protein N7492_004712 [Penicillium capsulatum]
MASSMWGQQLYGFNNSNLNNNLTKLAENGICHVEQFFKASNSWEQAGLFGVPVCEMTNMVLLPGINRVMRDYANDHYIDPHSLYSDNPCPCKNYVQTAKNGKTGNFTDFVNQKVVDSYGSKCHVSGSRGGDPDGGFGRI